MNWKGINAMNKRILNLLNLCLQADDEGHNCFFSYRPSTKAVEVEIFTGRKTYGHDELGNRAEINPDYSSHFYIDSRNAEEKCSEIEKVLIHFIETSALPGAATSDRGKTKNTSIKLYHHKCGLPMKIKTGDAVEPKFDLTKVPGRELWKEIERRVNIEKRG